jgi:hypothetical protein
MDLRHVFCSSSVNVFNAPALPTAQNVPEKQNDRFPWGAASFGIPKCPINSHELRRNREIHIAA